MSKEISEKIKKYSKDALNYRAMIDYIANYKEKIKDMALSGDISEDDFYNATSILSSQSRSPLWEKYFSSKIGGVKVKPAENKGDIFWNEKYYEFKISGFNVGNKLHVVQIRIWQDCDYIIVYNTPALDPVYFVLTHEQMSLELKKLNASSAHGTNEANEKNENIEYRFTISYDDEHYKRWTSEYMVKYSYFKK